LTAVPAVTSPLHRVRRRPPRSLLLVLVIAIVAACTGERPRLAEEKSTTTVEEEPAPEPEPQDAEVAQAKESSIEVFASADAETADDEVVAGEDTSVDTIPIVFLVKAREDGLERIEVYLPGAAGGGSGWVAADEVTLKAVPYRIAVGLSGHQLQVLRDDEVILDEPVGVGCDDRLEPGSVHYLTELLHGPDPDGAYGTYAYGLSGSTTLLEGIEEDEVTAIHGTDDPESVGADTSSGCLGVENEVIERMADEIGLPLGTPVEIRA
jgi:lipoprotein-anchoring transpeptidase ErfK/SrfK